MNNFIVMNIIDIMKENIRVLEPKYNVYETDQLDDEALALIMKPERNIELLKRNKIEMKANGFSVTKEKVETVRIDPSGTVFDIVHPNCICISEEGRIFVGDSMGSIYSCTVYVQGVDQFEVVKETRITHKELEGDQINSLILHPELPDHLFVQSRDNCVRLL